MSTPEEPQGSSFFTTIGAVLSAFVGIRKKRDAVVRVKPVHVIIAGIIGAALFVFAILMFVKVLLATH